MSPVGAVRQFRRFSYLVAGLAALYLVFRFDIYRLPASGCSPILRFSPGQNLLLDRNPRPAQVGDALVVAGDDGLLYLGVVERVDGDRAWVETDAPGCPGRGSSDFGWVEPGQISARVLMGL